MTARLEIRLKNELRDAEGEGVRRKARAYFGIEVEDIRTIRVLTIDAGLDAAQLERIRAEIFTNPVTEISAYQPLAADFAWLIWIGFRPGVRDTAGSTAVEAVQDLLGLGLTPEQGIYTSKLYELKGDLDELDVQRIAGELLANDIIQQWRIFGRDVWNPAEGIGFPIPRVVLNHVPRVTALPIGSNEALASLSLERNLALREQDIPVIRRYFLRSDVLEERRRVGLAMPTDVELEYISQARSDHCNHNTFQGLFRYRDLATGETLTVDNLFKTCIEEPTLKVAQEKDWVISVLWDNAGVGRFDDDHYYSITAETHNSPSNMEAYGGAITGIVGIYRDPLGTGKGSRLVLGMYGYCVGPRDYAGELEPRLHPRRLLDGVIEGVRDGGNKSGIPTPYGLLLFDDGYLGKCLVFVTAVGIMPARVGEASSHLKTTTPGDLILMCGGRVGKDGIHGVTASSETYSANTPAGHVQIGDPYTQKKMHDFLLEARDEGLIAYITDNGGGGLSSSIGESARFSNGCEVELDKVPLKYEGLDQWEIWVSESQERMTVAVKPEHLARFMALSAKHAVESTVIGRYTDSGHLHLLYKGQTCAYVRMGLLKSDFPQWEFEAEWVPPAMRGLSEPVVSEARDRAAQLRRMLARPNICARNWIGRQYDHEVQGGSVVKPCVGRRRNIPSDAAVIRPILTSKRGLAVTQTLSPHYARIDTYHMTAATIDEAVRRVVAVGGDPAHIGGMDNFCWPTVEYDPVLNPDGRYKAAQLVRANWALRDMCLAYGIPLLSGKDSMYIDGFLKGPFGEHRKVSGLPTLMFTTVSVIPDVERCVTMDLKLPGDLVYVVGTTDNELGAGEFYQMMGYVGLNVPQVDPARCLAVYRALHAAIAGGLLASCHAVGRGGLGVHLALTAMAGDLGLTLDLNRVPAQPGLTPSQILYSESCGRFIVTVAPDNRAAFEALLRDLPAALLGEVSERPVLTLFAGNAHEALLEAGVDKLRAAWEAPFGDLI